MFIAVQTGKPATTSTGSGSVGSGAGSSCISICRGPVQTNACIVVSLVHSLDRITSTGRRSLRFDMARSMAWIILPGSPAQSSWDQTGGAGVQTPAPPVLAVDRLLPFNLFWRTLQKQCRYALQRSIRTHRPESGFAPATERAPEPAESLPVEVGASLPI